MARKAVAVGSIAIDEEDRKLLRQLQADASRPLEQIATKVGLSKTAVWNRIQRLQQAGVITRQTVLVDAAKVGLGETFFVAIRTSQHRADWVGKLQSVIVAMPQITEAHRLAGHLDYLLKVQVENTQAFDAFYQDLVSRIDLFEVTSSLSMEVMKQETTLPV